MAEALNLMYSPEPSLQEGFIDKSTGLPLAFGLVFSFTNESRTVQKPIYTIQEATPGGPVNYVPLPNPIVLSGIGTIQDANGNDVIPYFYPYDDNGNIELYYILVTDQNGVQQFTRQAFPNVSPSSVTPSNVAFVNYISNGQLLIHNTPVSTGSVFALPNFNYGASIYTTKVLSIAPGGFTWEVSSGSIAVDNITFPRITQFITTEAASPRYSVNVNRTVGSLDVQCDLRVRFNDVFKFGSSMQNFTFLFTAFSANTIENVTVNLIKYYGSGGSPSTTVDEAFGTSGSPLTITTIPQQFAIVGTFTPDLNAFIGTNDDDFIQLAIRIPSSIALFNITFTDFILTPGTVSSVGTSFPPTTNGQFILDALSALAPTTTAQVPVNYPNETYYSEDGSNLYLPIVMTQQGFTYDYSQIGKIEELTTFHSFNTGNPVSFNTNLIMCDGSSYVTSAYSPLGIPYKRLQEQLWNSVALAPHFGTGTNFVTSYVYGSNTSLIKISTNAPGSQPVSLAGTSGFGVTTINTGNAGVGIQGFINNNSSAQMFAWGNSVGVTVEPVVDGSGGYATNMLLAQSRNFPLIRQIFVVDCSAALPVNTGGVNNGSYFQFGNTSTTYFMWFNYGTNTIPPGTGTPIQCNLQSGYTVTDGIGIIKDTLNGFQITNVLVSGVPTAGTYFQFSANSVTYTVYYTINGVGLIPLLPNPIQVALVTSPPETTATVATKTVTAINEYQFAVPNLYGATLRGFQGLTGSNYPIGPYDTEYNTRWGVVQNIKGANIGTYEFDDTEQHSHPPIAGEFIEYSGSGGVISVGASTNAIVGTTTGNSGGSQTTSFNVAIVYAIRY